MSEIKEKNDPVFDLSEIDILRKVSQIVSSTTDLTEILGAIAQTVATTFNNDLCSVCLIKPGGHFVCVEATNDAENKPSTSFCLTTENNRIIEKIMAEQQPLIIPDISNEPDIKVLLRPGGDDYLSLIAIPIMRDSKVVGILMLQNRSACSYSMEKISILTIISHNLNVALRNAELYENVKTRFDELKVIHEISKAITSILDIDELLPYICKEVSNLFSAKGCIIRLLEGEALNIKASYGLPEEIKKEMSLRLGNGIAGHVAMTGEPMIVDNARQMPENLRVPGIEATSVLCVPLIVGKNIIGTLGLYNKKTEWGAATFTEEELNRLVTFASASSVAIENARLYRKELERENDMLSLYLEVTQTKDYLKSLIDNSPDAIVISDINGIITSWNKGAEKIYLYTEEEALGKFLPMVPEFLAEEEKNNIKKILQKQILSDLETIRQRKNGEFIEVSLTLSPVLDSYGNITGISGISRDISEKKRIEKELIKKNNELSRLFIMSSAVKSTIKLEKLARMVLSAVTMSDGLGFNRAILFLIDKGNNALKGEMGVGPASFDEAREIWQSIGGKNLENIISEIDSDTQPKESSFDKLSRSFIIDLGKDSIFSRCIKEKTFYNVTEAEAQAPANLMQQFMSKSFGVVPLLSGGEAIGLIWVDNLFSGKTIKNDDLQSLMIFTSHIVSSIENAKLFENVSLARAELKNIFESITDMVYFTDKDCVIRRINQAVIKKLGKSEEEIIGQKCFEMFHGKEEHSLFCPHIKTMTSHEPSIEEIDDQYLGGTFVISSSPIFDSSGTYAGTVHVARDITELNALRDKVTSSERMAALGELAAKVAHEIRNPLVSVGGFARRLLNSTEGQAHEFANIIVNEVTRLEYILKEILGFVKGPVATKSSMDINLVLKETIDFITPEVNSKGNEIINLLSESPIMVVIDKNGMREAILNIITNANNATENGTIAIRTCSDNNEALIEISDSGCGIRPEELNNIFNPFYTTRPDGTGLGLSVTNKIILEHSGRIEVESHFHEPGDTEVNKGSAFKVYFPLDISHTDN
ncbi:MAG: PAS domain S-box protein [Thermodesulfovibrionia bacterium]|nr:PAS domain S-box protein [Thermodesulfovibrionia bacterium]